MDDRNTAARGTHLEGDDVALWCPLIHQWLKDFRYLIHLDEQTAFSALDFVLRLNSRKERVVSEVL